MRLSGTWMTIWDDRILEIIRAEDAGRVGDLAERDAIRISQSSVSRRCKKLAENSLLRPLGNGVYTISDKGEAYLDGEYDAENDVYLKRSSS
ncbi:MarR family transcriptional regulator [Natronolimnobius sp. AArcel1]|uniref:MarR family transcriptional regulator n=1 Tax=Natronolimnobius sp. AArcel1 TaxID=1679093 RepID=UPI0013EC597B|nr:helix-turn-helix domain-containing protein [Natronolimnobius sp. AArcel1]NGM71104.1 MarR family transcriptional regulator [Natronolimnobius sp. AArcel1]